MTTTQIELWTSAAEAFDARHRLLEQHHNTMPTPCSDFDVAALIQHATGTQIGIGQIFGSEASEGNSWEEARDAMAAALTKEGSTDGMMEHPAFGEIPREHMLAIATNDLLIHTWDLARAIGADETLPEQNLQPAIDGINAFPTAFRESAFATPPDVDLSASLQDQMLATAGRAA